MMYLLFLPLVTCVSIFTKTEPSIEFDLFNVPIETNFFGHFEGYNMFGKPKLVHFHQFEDTLVDNRSQTYKINKNCTFDVIGDQELLMHCFGRLLKITRNETHLLDIYSDLFTFDHVHRQIYLWRDPYIYKLEAGDSNPSWRVENLQDFNVVSGLLTILFTNGTIVHNDSVLTSVNPKLYTRLPIFAAPDFEYTRPDSSIKYLTFFIFGSLIILMLEKCGARLRPPQKTTLIRLTTIKEPSHPSSL